MTAKDAWGQVAHQFRILADSIDAAIDPAAPPAVQDRVPSRPAAAEAGVPPAPASAPRQDAALGYCPTHGVPWSVQPGGISKRTNKRYSAFWKCKEKDGDNYCNEKPVPVWADTHPAEEPPPPARRQAEDTDDLPF